MGEINDRPTCRSLARPLTPLDVNDDVRSGFALDGGDEINDRFCSMTASQRLSGSTLKSGVGGLVWSVTQAGDHLFRPYLTQETAVLRTTIEHHCVSRAGLEPARVCRPRERPTS